MSSDIPAKQREGGQVLAPNAPRPPILAEGALEPIIAVLPTNATANRIGDRDIRGALLATLDQRNQGSDTLVISELSIAFGYVKLDVAVLNGRLHGYEIKSDRDTLARLERQMEWYARVCDRLTIVTTERYLEAVERAVPSWCGIIVASVEAATMSLAPVQEPSDNPEWDIHALLLLLWQDETQQLARNFGLKVPRQLAKGLTHRLLASRVPHDVLRSETLSRLRARDTWTPNQLWRADS